MWVAVTATLYVHCTALYCIALHYIALHCTALHKTGLHCTALHYTQPHCNALHCTAQYYTELQGVIHLLAVVVVGMSRSLRLRLPDGHKYPALRPQCEETQGNHLFCKPDWTTGLGGRRWGHHQKTLTQCVEFLHKVCTLYKSEQVSLLKLT